MDGQEMVYNLLILQVKVNTVKMFKQDLGQFNSRLLKLPLVHFGIFLCAIPVLVHVLLKLVLCLVFFEAVFLLKGSFDWTWWPVASVLRG